MKKMYMTDYMARTKQGRIIILKKAIEIMEEMIKNEQDDENSDDKSENKPRKETKRQRL